MTDDVEEPEEDAETKSTATRWRWTGTIGAFILLIDLSALVLVYAVDDRTVPLWVAGAFMLAVLAAVAWTFGPSKLKAAKDAAQTAVKGEE